MAPYWLPLGPGVALHRIVRLPRRAVPPTTAELRDLVAELSTRRHLFRKLWGSHDVREHRTGIKRITTDRRDLDLTFQGADPSSELRLQMLVCSAEPGAHSHDGLQLATWADTNSAKRPVIRLLKKS